MKAGDIVIVKGQKVLMTVQHNWTTNNNFECDCVWFDKKGRLHEKTFQRDILVLAYKKKDSMARASLPQREPTGPF